MGPEVPLPMLMMSCVILGEFFYLSEHKLSSVRCRSFQSLHRSAAAPANSLWLGFSKSGTSGDLVVCQGV